MEKTNIGLICKILLLLPWFLARDFTLAQSTTTSSPQEDFRLPGNLIPESYNLLINTSLNENNFAFWGNVVIIVECVTATNTVVLHSRNLSIFEGQVTVDLVDGSTRIGVVSHDYDLENDFYIITLDADLVADQLYQIYIPFQAPLESGSIGYFRSSYQDGETGTTRWLSLTQFDPIYARAAFPCLDEVGLKATFTISLAHDATYSALSNMPLASINEIPEQSGWVMSVFEESIPLPPTNVCFVICDFAYKELIIPETNVALRAWTRSDVLYQVDLTLDTLMRAIIFDEQLYDVPYPIDKLDMVIVPEYVVGSESFFGLILVREIGVLFDPQVNTNFNERNVVGFTCQMTNQQWFNNLVTQKWWNGIWLGTGLVNYFEVIVTSQLYPEWNLDVRAFVSNFVNVLSADSSQTSHPLQVDIVDLNEIDQLYDTITFEKGAFVLRMLQIIVGENVFQLGVSNFLKEFEYGIADQFDFWNSMTNTLQLAGGIYAMDLIMNPWTLQAGYPYLVVEIDYNQQTVTVTQERYLFDDLTDEEAAERKSYCWPVPLTYTTSIELDFDDLTIKEWATCEGPLIFPLQLSENDWVVFNVGLTVLCRINYSDNNWESIVNTLADETSFELIDVKNRMQIMNDLFSFASAEIINYDFVFNAMMYLQYEMNFLPWSVTLDALRDIRSFFQRTDLYEPFQACVRQILEPVYYKLGEFGIVPEDYYEAGFKYQLTFWSCEYKVDSCQLACLESLRSWEAVSNPDEFNPINVDLRTLVYCQALRIANQNDWYFLWERYQNMQVPLEKSALLGTLGCIQDEFILQQFLNWSIDPNVFRPQDSFEVFLRVADSGVGYEICKEFFMTRFQELYTFVNGDPDIIGQYLPILYVLSRTQEEVDELNSFVETIRPQLIGTELQLQDSIDFAEFILAWIQKFQPIFEEILLPISK